MEQFDLPAETIELMRFERKILTDGGIEAVKLILKKLDKAADAMVAEYDSIDYAREPEKAIRVQMFRRVVKVEIPRIVENLITLDRPETVTKFNFLNWIKSLTVSETK